MKTAQVILDAQARHIARLEADNVRLRGELRDAGLISDRHRRRAVSLWEMLQRETSDVPAGSRV